MVEVHKYEWNLAKTLSQFQYLRKDELGAKYLKKIIIHCWFHFFAGTFIHLTMKIHKYEWNLAKTLSQFHYLRKDELGAK